MLFQTLINGKKLRHISCFTRSVVITLFININLHLFIYNLKLWMLILYMPGKIVLWIASFSTKLACIFIFHMFGLNMSSDIRQMFTLVATGIAIFEPIRRFCHPGLKRLCNKFAIYCLFQKLSTYLSLLGYLIKYH